jgi:hypothetical protein
MSYREKSAWLSLFAMAVAFIPYFVLSSQRAPLTALPDLGQIWLYGKTVAVQLLVLGAGHLWLRRSAPADARLPPDERDQGIERRSMQLAYYVLICSAILVGCVMPFYARGWQIVNATILGIVIAELVHYGSAAWSYRRQA